MKETLMVTDEAYRSDMERLWRKIRTLRDTTEYKDVTFTLQNWMIACDGENLKSGLAANVSMTDLFFKLSQQPTNAEMLAVMVAGGLDADSDLPVLLTFTLDVQYTRIN
ncbi:hypothetical protein pEaSNUABM37_00318 [Erwinia phage pEa_SNUABM_37]|nr:hypothetical protein pEaSNUABM37_00318 [Erwinia phage pEa_SNUABM_37]QXO10786.1 hypothetical protein pEaSNUABM48_00318 [Erwinia phage pEa_SNUABM_48]